MLRLQQLRLAQRLTQTQVGRDSGVNQTTISAAENGYLRLRPSQLERLAIALGWEGDPQSLLDEIEVSGHEQAQA